ncbi:MAG: acyl-CoA dehydrogenase family protein [Trueperaceae bacterium]|nr:acyl-CoA dehydrogenase family protein [Trueperaceae bacterium]
MSYWTIASTPRTASASRNSGRRASRSCASIPEDRSLSATASPAAPRAGSRAAAETCGDDRRRVVAVVQSSPCPRPRRARELRAARRPQGPSAPRARLRARADRDRRGRAGRGADVPPRDPRRDGADGADGRQRAERYGGAGLGTLAFTVAIEEISAADASHGTLMAVTNGLPQKMLVAYGSEAQKEAYLPKLASGAWFGAFCLSEAQAGSDAAAIRTRASAVPDGYRLRGAKAWVTGGGEADLYLVLAVTDPEAGHVASARSWCPGTRPACRSARPSERWANTRR